MHPPTKPPIVGCANGEESTMVTQDVLERFTVQALPPGAH